MFGKLKPIHQESVLLGSRSDSHRGALRGSRIEVQWAKELVI